MEARTGLTISILLLLSATTPVASVTTTPEPLTTESTTPDPTTSPNPTTSAEPTTTAELTTTADPATVTTMAATTRKPSTTTAAATAATAAPTTVANTTKVVTFTSRLDTFTDDLKDSSTPAFKSRATTIKDQLDPVFQKEFNSSYITMDVVSFSNGSIINTINVVFKSSSVPTGAEVRTALANAASVVVGFDIDGSSIVIDGSTSSGVSHRINLVTAAVVVLTSWLLSSHP